MAARLRCGAWHTGGVEDDLDFEVASEWGDDDLGHAGRRRRSWVRATAIALAALLFLSTAGTVTLVLVRRAARASCDTAAFAELDFVGTSVADARRTLERAPYRCSGDVTVTVAVTDVRACDRDRPGTIVRQGRLAYDTEGSPYVPVAVCGSAITV